MLLRWGLLQGCAVIPKSVNPDHIDEFSESALLMGTAADAADASASVTVPLAAAMSEGRSLGQHQGVAVLAASSARPLSTDIADGLGVSAAAPFPAAAAAAAATVPAVRGWTWEDDLVVLGLERSLVDGHKYCWDPTGIR